MSLISAGRLLQQPAAARPDRTLSAEALEAMRRYRYARVQRLLRENDCAALLLANPINIRYATDHRNMTVWLLHNLGRYCLVPAEGHAVMFEYANRNCFDHVPALPAIGEVRPVTVHSFCAAQRCASCQFEAR